MPGVNPFLFIHIRKTAGVSLRALLVNQFPQDRVLTEAHAVNGPQEPGDALFVTGHVGFDYANRFSCRPTVFTVLRDPLSHALSGYYFYRGNDEHFFRAIADHLSPEEYESRRRFTDRAQRLDMLRFLEREEPLARRWLSNVQTRQLAGYDTGLSGEDPRLLDIAVSNLNRCDLVGLVERLPETLAQLQRLMRAPGLGPLQHENQSSRPSASAVDPRCIEILRSWNSLDTRLYDRAADLFDERMKDFSEDVRPPETSFDPASFPDGRSFTPAMPIKGYGWHIREFHNGKWLCWNSAPVATLFLSQSGPRPSRFKCLLSHRISRAVVEQLEISLNSVPLRCDKKRTDGGILLESPLPPEAIDGPLAKLTVNCPVMARPCDINRASTDSRSLGVALGWTGIE